MLQESVRELRDGEDENQVEEQLDEAHPGMLAPAPRAQEIGTSTGGRHGRSLLLKANVARHAASCALSSARPVGGGSGSALVLQASAK
jgi:hypothetical protein